MNKEEVRLLNEWSLHELKIEREAVKKDTDQASRKRLKKLEDDIATLGKEYADLEEIWKAEKASMQGATHIKSELEQAKVDLDAAHREGNLEKMAELQYHLLYHQFRIARNPHSSHPVWWNFLLNL